MKGNAHNVVLIRATILNSQDTYSGNFGEEIYAESMGIAYLKAYLEQVMPDLTVKILNPIIDKLSLLDILNKIVEYEPLLIGISVCHQWQMPWIKELTAKIREKYLAIHIILGGKYASAAWNKLLLELPVINSVCRYEGEQTLGELIKNLLEGKDWRNVKGLGFLDEKGVPVFNGRRSLIGYMNNIPSPCRSQLLKIIKKNSVIQIEASRGCNAHCTFCNERESGWVAKPVDRFVDELEQLTNQFPGHEIVIIDSTFIGFGKKRFERAQMIAESIIKRKLKISFNIMERADNIDFLTFKKLKEAGLSGVFLGIESFSDSALKRWEKGCDAATNKQAIQILQKLQIFTSIGFLVFDDVTTIDEIEESVNGLKEVTHDNGYLSIINFNEIIPYTGTAIEKQRIDKFIDIHERKGGESIWKFLDAGVSLICSWAWRYLTLLWPINKLLVEYFNNQEFKNLCQNFLPVKNALFIEFLQMVIKNVKKKEPDDKLLQDLFKLFIKRNKIDLLRKIKDWPTSLLKQEMYNAINSIGGCYEADVIGEVYGLPGAGIIGLITKDHLHPMMIDNESVWKDGMRWKEGAILSCRRLASLAKIKKNSRVLDVGFGIGGPARFLVKELGCNIVGINISHMQINTARRLTEKKLLDHTLKFGWGDAEAIPFEDKSFDVVWTMNMFYHINDKTAAIREFRRILKDQGTLAFEDWMITEKTSTVEYEKLLKTWQCPSILTLNQTIDLLKANHFQVTVIEDVSSVGSELMSQYFIREFEKLYEPKIKMLFPYIGADMAFHFKEDVQYIIDLYKKGHFGYYRIIAGS